MIKTIPSDQLCDRLSGLAEKFGKEIFKPSKLIRDGAYALRRDYES